MIGALTGYGLYYMTNYLGIAAGLAGVIDRVVEIL